MTFNVSLILWLIMLVLVVQFVPVNWKWGKLTIWAILTLVTMVLVLLKALVFK